MLMRLAFLAAMLAALAGRARADEVACDAPRAGIVACLAGKLCACRFERGGLPTECVRERVGRHVV